MIGGQGTFSIPSFRLCCAARNFRSCLSRALLSHKTAFGSQESALLRHKALSCLRNPHCYTAKHFSAPEICIVTQQSAFLPQESALLRHKALSCPKKRHCSSTKHFPVPEFRLVGQQSIFLPQKSALLRHNALFCPNFRSCFEFISEAIGSMFLMILFHH